MVSWPRNLVKGEVGQSADRTNVGAVLRSVPVRVHMLIVSRSPLHLPLQCVVPELQHS